MTGTPMRTVGAARAAPAVLGVALAVAACLQTEEFPPRTRVGTIPEGFAARPVTFAGDTAAYVDAYTRALGVEEVRAERVLGFDGRYWVYVVERGHRPVGVLQRGL